MTILYFKPRSAGYALDDLECLMDEKGLDYTVLTTTGEPHLLVDGDSFDYESAQNWVESQPYND